MTVNAIIPNVQPIPFAVPSYTPNGQLYPQTNSGKIIGGTVGAIAGLSTSGSSGIVQASINTATMSAIGVGIGAAVDYIINKQREQISNSIDLQA